MRYAKEEFTCNSDHAIDLNLAVEQLNGLASKELNKLLKESESFTINCNTEKGSLVQIDMERLAWSLPLHLIAVLLSPGRNDRHLTYLLRGVRLLYSLSDLASRHTRLEQILLDEVKVSEQILDLVFYMLIVLGRHEQDNCLGSSPSLFHSTLVACSFHLLTGNISPQWQDLVLVLLAHPKVDIFMDVAFDAVHVDIKFLHINLSALNNDVLCNKSSILSADRTARYFCQQCEASLQFLLSLCQQKLFRDRLLKNKAAHAAIIALPLAKLPAGMLQELCQNGGILSLARTTLKLSIPDCFKESFDIVATVSRLKAKVLSILLQLCEAESISYLDEVAASSKSMPLAKVVALEILNLLKAAFRREPKQLGDSLRANPNGLVLLNSMRLADIFSDDSNFRSFFMTNITQVLVEILAVPHEEFLSSWCSIDVPMIEEDASLEYDPFMAAGVALASLTLGGGTALSAHIILNETSAALPGILNGMPSVSYAQQRTSYLVKIIANLHCFVPNICEEEERNLFLNKFNECLLMDSGYPSNCNAQKAATICENLCSLSDYAVSLIHNFLNEDDVQLLSLFSKQLLALVPPQFGDNLTQEPHFKDVGGKKLEDARLLQQFLPNRTNFSNSNFSRSYQVNAGTSFHDNPCGHSPGREPAGNDDRQLTEDAQSTGGAPSLLKKLNDDVDVKSEIPESSSFQEVDQFNITSKCIDLPDDFEFDQNRRKNIISTVRSASGSSRGIEKEIQNFERNGIEVSSCKGGLDLISGASEFSKIAEYAKESGFQEDEKAESVHGEEKQPRKRKRNIMNDRQVVLIENALLEEPDMQRNAPSLQSWADKLSVIGSELTSSQLKNWLNNRKARLARAAREVRGSSEGENTYADKSNGSSASHFYDSPESAGEEFHLQSTRGSSHQNILKSDSTLMETASGENREILAPVELLDSTVQHIIQMRFVPSEPGQLVSLVDLEGKEVGKGKVYQVDGWWHGKNLEEAGTNVVDVTELKVEKWKEVQHPSEAAGMTFEEAATRNGGIMRVAWDTIGILHLPQ